MNGSKLISWMFLYVIPAGQITGRNQMRLGQK